MKATYEIIARKGLEGLVIQDITEAADVGYGSFYNHFSSKEAIVEAVVDAALGHSSALYGRLAAPGADQVEALGMEVRSCLEMCRADPVWGWFIIRTMLSGAQFRLSIGAHIQQSIERGIAAGVFVVEDLDMARQTVGGLLLIGTLKVVNNEADEHYPYQVAYTVLRLLSVPAERIKTALTQPLPDISWMPFLEAA